MSLTTPEKKRSRVLRPLNLLLILLLLAGAAAVYWHLSGRVSFTGEVKESVISLSPGLSGTVSRIEVREGQTVRKGQPLVILDSAAQRRVLAEERQKLAQLEALLPPQHARMSGTGADDRTGDDESLEQRLDRQRKEEAAAERRLQSAADYEAQAAIIYNRAVMLVSRGELPARDRDAAAAALEDARQATLNARAAFESLSLARSGTVAEIRRVKENQNAIGADTLPANLRIKNYELQRERARAAAAELEAAVLRAPEDGRVTEITVRPGGPATAGVPCVYLAPLDKAVTVVAQVGDDAAKKLRLRQQCRLEIAGAPDTPFAGHISAFLPKSASGAAQDADVPPASGVRVQITVTGVDKEDKAPTGKAAERELPYLPGGARADVTVLLRADLVAENGQPRPVADMPPATGKPATVTAPAAAPAVAPTIAPATAQPVSPARTDASDAGSGGQSPQGAPIAPDTRPGPADKLPDPAKARAEEAANPEGRVLPPVHPPAARPAANASDPLEGKRPLPDLPPMPVPEKITGTVEPDPKNNPSLVTPEILEREANRER